MAQEKRGRREFLLGLRVRIVLCLVVIIFLATVATYVLLQGSCSTAGCRQGWQWILLGIGILAATSGGWMTRQLTRPIAEVERYAAQSLQEQVGLPGTKPLLQRKDEIGRIARAIHDLSRKIHREESELKAAKSHAEVFANELSKAKDELIQKICALEISQKKTGEANRAIEEYTQRFEAKVQERTKELQQANAEIVTLLDAKNEFIGRIAHDLRTPITPLMLMLPILRKRLEHAMDEKDKCNCQVVFNNINYLSKLINDTLMLANLDAEKIEFKKEPVDIREVIEEAVKAAQQRLEEEGFSIELAIKDATIIGDRLKLLMVFENIIENTIRFAKQKKEGRKIVFKVMQQGKRATISIVDNGIGVEEGRLESIFDEFSKIDPSRHEHSSGLGLAICKRIINKLGGNIWAESEGINKGLTISFMLPSK